VLRAMIGIDTKVLLRLLLDDNAAQGLKIANLFDPIEVSAALNH
jgi:predicted nucleic-acid-binding protein